MVSSFSATHNDCACYLFLFSAASLHGVDIIAETSVLVTNKSQTFHWAGYGLRLHIPPTSLPAGVGQSDIVIKASLTGPFQFPENTTLVSAVFWLQCPVKFTKPLTLEIEHCGKHSGTLNFVRANHSQIDLPYKFKPLEGSRSTFSSENFYGRITIFSFSGVAVTQEGSEEQNYCARLYYIGSKVDWRVHFIVIKDLEAFITVRRVMFLIRAFISQCYNLLILQVVNQSYKKKGAIEGPDQDIEFEKDEITMEIPEGGSIIGGWTIRAVTPLMVCAHTL